MIKKTAGLFNASPSPVFGFGQGAISNADHKLLKTFANVFYPSFKLVNLNTKCVHTIDSFPTEPPNDSTTAVGDSDGVKSGSRKREQRPNKVQKHFWADEHSNAVLSAFPPDFSRLKRKADQLFVAEDSVAVEIAARISEYVPTSEHYIIEVNPGPGILTRKLLDSRFRLKLVESDGCFIPRLQELKSKNSNILAVIKQNFHNLQYALFLDGVDGGSRYYEFLSNFESKPWESDTLKVVMAASYTFPLTKLLFSCYKRFGIASCGRPEIYCVMTPSIFRRLNASPLKDKTVYRLRSVLFQIAFDYEILQVFSRQSFLPWIAAKKFAYKSGIFFEMREEDKDKVYLVKITGKKDFYSNFSKEGGSNAFFKFAKWFLKRPNAFIIPVLEEHFPNCGPKLISKGIGVFARFNDLTAAEFLSLFALFERLPNFGAASFLMEEDIYHYDEAMAKASEADKDDEEDREDNEEDDEMDHL